jgi:hypothetical protein
MAKRSPTITVAIIGAVGVIVAAVISAILQPSWWRSEPHPRMDLAIAGTVVEESTNEGVGQASLSIVGRAESYVTEDNGNFRIEVKSAVPMDRVVRLHVVKKGYLPYDGTTTATENLVIELARIPGSNSDTRVSHGAAEVRAGGNILEEPPAANGTKQSAPTSRQSVSEPTSHNGVTIGSIYPAMRFSGRLGFTTAIQRVTFHGERAFRVPAGICWSLWCYKNSYLYIGPSRVAFDCRENNAFSFDVPRPRVTDVLPDLELRVVRDEKPEQYNFFIVWEDSDGNRDYNKGDWKPAANFANLALNDFVTADKRFDEIAASGDGPEQPSLPTNTSDPKHLTTMKLEENGLLFEVAGCPRSGQSVNCTAIITNKAAKRRVLCEDTHKSYFVDNNGNTYPVYYPASSGSSCGEIESELAVKGVASAKNVDVSATSLTFVYVYKIEGDSWSKLVFRNMPISQK